MFQALAGFYALLKLILNAIKIVGQILGLVQKTIKDRELADIQNKADERKKIEDELTKGNVDVERKKKLLEELAKHSN